MSQHSENQKTAYFDPEKIAAKKDEYQCRLTTSLRGRVKNLFLDECLKSGMHEADLARAIITKHYTEKRF